MTMAVQQHNLKILTTSAANFARNNGPEDELLSRKERPMMLNAWTQTSGDDFEILKDIDTQREQQQQKQQQQQQTVERNKTTLQLLEKIRLLEESLRAHSDIFQQLHTSITPSSTSTIEKGSTEREVQQQQQQQLQLNSECTQQQRMHLKIEERNQSGPSPTTQLSSVNVKEAIKYTIIAERQDGSGCEPIEIQLAEAEGEEEDLNLNSSAESGRLEICLTEEGTTTGTAASNGTATAAAGTLFQQQQQQPQPTNYTMMQHNQLHTISTEYGVKRRRYHENGDMNNYQTQGKYYINNDGITMVEPIQSAISNNNIESVETRMKHIKTIPKIARAEPIYHPNQQAPSPINTTNVNINNNNNNNNNNNYSDGNENDIGHSTNIKKEEQHNIENVMVSIGPNNTRIPAKLYETMSWASASIATRKLLMTIFGRNILATHSMTGKPSPAFKDHGKPLKQMLDQFIIQDIIFAVTHKCNVSEKEVRSAITTKCADENKMMKLQQNKMRSLRELNKENDAKFQVV